MRVRDYEYNVPDYENYISEERRKNLIDKLQSKYYKKDNTIPLFEVLKLTNNDDECLFMYEWLDNHGIVIRGLNGTISKNVTNYEELIHKPKKYPQCIPVEEQMSYFERIEAGDKEARKEFIAKNIRLANWVVGKLRGKSLSKKDMSMDEKLSYAYEGLIKAVDNFKYKKTYIDDNGKRKHYAFSTYAVPTIYNTILRNYALQRRDETGFGIQALSLMDLIANVEEEFEIYNEKASDQDISNIIGISPDVIAEKRKMMKTIKDIKENESIEEIAEKELDNNFLDNVADGEKVSITPNGYVVEGVYVEPDKETEKKQISTTEADPNYDGVPVADIIDTGDLKQKTEEALSTLTSREAKVLKVRFGLDGFESKTLEQTGQMFEVTRERIRQIEAKALRKLRHPSRSKKIRDFLDTDVKLVTRPKYTRMVVPNLGLDIYSKNNYEFNGDEPINEFNEMLDQIPKTENVVENKENPTTKTKSKELIELEELMKHSKELRKMEIDLDNKIAELENNILRDKERTR